MASTTSWVNLEVWTCQAPHAPGPSMLLPLLQSDAVDEVNGFFAYVEAQV
jgi:hypothetical protein